MSEREDVEAIRGMIAAMEEAWNAGDLVAYMAGFANPDVVFVSDGQIRGDWQSTLNHYVMRYGHAPEALGRLSFEIRSIELLGPDAAVLISEFHLDRSERPLTGINTRVLRKRNGWWIIVHNHVSAHA